MSNVIDFAKFATDRHLRGLFREPAAHTHAVQFYEDESFLLDTIGQFVEDGLTNGDCLIVIATKQHTTGLLSRLASSDVQHPLDDRNLLLYDAEEALTKFMIGDMPDPDLFRDFLEQAMVRAKGENSQRRVRAYGEMVDVLWTRGNSRAAIRLEELWNEAQNEHSFTLLCAYVMGNFYREGDSEKFMEVCRTHSHVVPTEKFARLDDANARLREISLLQQRARSLEHEIDHRRELEDALRNALRERTKVLDELRASIKRESEARVRAEANDAFKEMFLGILGHDLRNPLNTVLTTARMMSMREDIAPDHEKKLGRIVSSGVRMQRMIEQLLDVTRARLADGIPVRRGQERDLVPLVIKIVDEIRAVHPMQGIEVVASPCMASIDPDRFEQVLSNMLANAAKHGDPEKPIRVEVSKRGGLAIVSVHNRGVPIDPELIPRLFDPFKRTGRSPGSADGLGLGLYIAERIVTAHGGKIEVQSTSETGTRFTATFPCR